MHSMFHTTPASLFLTAVSAVSAMSMKLNSAFIHLLSIAAVDPRSPSLMDERLVSAVEHGLMGSNRMHLRIATAYALTPKA